MYIYIYRFFLFYKYFVNIFKRILISERSNKIFVQVYLMICFVFFREILVDFSRSITFYLNGIVHLNFYNRPLQRFIIFCYRKIHCVWTIRYSYKEKGEDECFRWETDYMFLILYLREIFYITWCCIRNYLY